MDLRYSLFENRMCCVLGVTRDKSVPNVSQSVSHVEMRAPGEGE